MRTLAFGTLRPCEGGSVGDFALHIQCPWRVEGPEGIVTGRLDLWEPLESSTVFDADSWHYEKSPNLQDFLMDQWLKRHGPSLVVEGVDGDECGGASIRLGKGFRLELFPAGTCSEDWRLFRPRSDDSHFVVSGGRVETYGEDDVTTD